MRPDRPATRLAGYAHLPRAYRDLHNLHSTVDAFGRAHWLLTERPPEPRGKEPYDAVVVTVENGRTYETHLGAVRARFAKLDALPDGVSSSRAPAVGAMKSTSRSSTPWGGPHRPSAWATASKIS